jgi:hypothetical protein
MIRNTLLLLSLPFIATNTAAPSLRESVPVIREDETALQLAMQTLKVGQRSLKKQVSDVVANKDSLLATLDKMEAAVLVAIGEKVTAPEGLAGVDLALFNVGYKRQMVKLLGNILELREATLLEDSDAAKAAYGELSGAKKAGHQTYQVD